MTGSSSNHLRTACAAVVVMVVLVSTVAPLRAIAPSIIMIYGAPLAAPVFIRHRDANDIPRFADYWCGGVRGSVPAADRLTDRPYLNLAIFWAIDLWTDPATFDRVRPTLRPDDAHQHARFYLPTGEAPALIVSTQFVRFDATARPPTPIVARIPTALDQFAFACLPGGQALSELLALAVP